MTSFPEKTWHTWFLIRKSCACHGCCFGSLRVNELVHTTCFPHQAASEQSSTPKPVDDSAPVETQKSKKALKKMNKRAGLERNERQILLVTDIFKSVQI